MHCPRCGQQQVSEEIKFCSRCGFSLALVSEVLANNGSLPQLTAVDKQDKKWLTRGFGLKISLLWFLFIVLILTPLAGITKAPGPVMGALGVIGVCGSLMLLALSFLFLPKANKSSSSGDYAFEGNAPQFLRGNANQTALPPQTSQPVSSYAPPSAGAWKAPETGDLVPASVTENTTKLLQKDK